jgi:GDP-L-fucose synthase
MSAAPDRSFWAGRNIVVTGGTGFFGSAVGRLLASLDAEARLIGASEHDLRDMDACLGALDDAEIVIHLAANAGGIGYNLRNPAPLVHDNVLIGANVFEACHQLGVPKLVAVSSVCAYPKNPPVPFSESELWSGYPEGSNAPYGVAKRVLSVLSDSYRRQYGLNSCVPVPTNLYGPGDNFDPEDSHVIAAMIHKYVHAREGGESQVVLWGTGEPTREFLYVDDGARALLLAAEHCDTSEPFNVGTGIETSVGEIAETIARLVGYEGETVWDTSRPDGQQRRFLDVQRAREWLGFEAEVPLEEGLRRTIDSFRTSLAATPG